MRANEILEVGLESTTLKLKLRGKNLTTILATQEIFPAIEKESLKIRYDIESSNK